MDDLRHVSPCMVDTLRRNGQYLLSWRLLLLNPETRVTESAFHLFHYIQARTLEYKNDPKVARLHILWKLEQVTCCRSLCMLQSCACLRVSSSASPPSRLISTNHLPVFQHDLPFLFQFQRSVACQQALIKVPPFTSRHFLLLLHTFRGILNTCIFCALCRSFLGATTIVKITDI